MGASIDSHVDRGDASYRAKQHRAVSKTVRFAGLVSMSSLGTHEAREHRLIGRKEIDSYLTAELKPESEEESSVDFNLEVADDLELRGYTFESELWYRRLCRTSSTAAARLALLLEAKGRRTEAIKLYMHAAQENDTNSLLRLSVMCSQRGQQDWAENLLWRAASNLPKETLDLVIEQASSVCHLKHSAALGGAVVDAARRDGSDAAFALGSFFFVIADRSDLARLAYGCALPRDIH